MFVKQAVIQPDHHARNGTYALPWAVHILYMDNAITHMTEACFAAVQVVLQCALFAFKFEYFCRYVWLPMWVQEQSQVQDSQSASIWDKLNPLHLGSKATPPPVEVDIKWYDGWSMANFTGHHFNAREQMDITDDNGDLGSTDEDEDDTMSPVDSAEADGNSIPEDPDDEDNTGSP